MRHTARRLALTAAVALMAASTLAACSKSGGGAAASTEDMSLGDPKAKVTVIEYASVACSHCARWNAEVWPAFKAKYVDTNKVNYVFREFITQPPQLAAAGTLLARCASKGDKAKYFSVLDAVFHSQAEIFSTGDIRGPLVRVAQSAGMSEAQFNACVGDEAALKAFNDRVQTYATRDKIESTPTFLINGKKLEGEQTLPALDAAIAAASK